MAIIILCYGLAYLFVYPLTTLRRKENTIVDQISSSQDEIVNPSNIDEKKSQ